MDNKKALSTGLGVIIMVIELFGKPGLFWLVVGLAIAFVFIAIPVLSLSWKKLSKLILLLLLAICLAILGYKLWPDESQRPLTEKDKQYIVDENEKRMKKELSRIQQASPDMVELKGSFDRMLPRLKKPTRESIQDRIILYERYPMEWPETSLFSETIILSNEKVLRAVFEKGKDYRLTPAIFNANDGIPLNNTNIVIKLLDDKIKIKSSQKWQQGSHRDCHTSIPVSIVYPIPQGVLDHLVLEFPKADKYPVEYVVTATTPYSGADSVHIEGRFFLELIGEKNK
jgi:hypothetical protein